MPSTQIADFLPQRRLRSDGWTTAAQLGFLDELGRSGSVERAARTVGLSVSGAYRLRARADADAFRRGWQAAAAMAYHSLRELALDRILHGVETPVFHKGEQVGSRLVHSDRLLVAMLDHLRPDAPGRSSSRSARTPSRPAADPTRAYALALTAFADAVEHGGEPVIPVEVDHPAAKPPISADEFLAIIATMPRSHELDDPRSGEAGDDETPAFV